MEQSKDKKVITIRIRADFAEHLIRAANAADFLTYYGNPGDPLAPLISDVLAVMVACARPELHRDLPDDELLESYFRHPRYQNRKSFESPLPDLRPTLS